MSVDDLRFWRWLACGIRGEPSGLRGFLDRWLLIHVAVGGVLGWYLDCTVASAASAVLLPLAGVLVGLCFAWGGNANALLQTEELERLTKTQDGGIRNYVFTYQVAMLVLIATLVAWGLAGLGLFDQLWPKMYCPVRHLITKWLLFSLSSIAVRECWHVVLGANLMLLMRSEARRAKARRTPDGGNHSVQDG